MNKKNENCAYTISIGAKSPTAVPYSAGSVEITREFSESDNFEHILDDLKGKLEEALAVAVLVAEGNN